jgi:hypothetical protein
MKLTANSVKIIIAIIGFIGVLVTALLTYLPKPQSNPANTPAAGFDYYKVRVTEKTSGDFVNNAKVTIELSGNIVPLTAVTDSDGFAIIKIPSDYMNQPGKLIVEAQNYQLFSQYIELSEGTLPSVVQLEKK